MAGYHYLDHVAWIDAFDQTAMIVGGMGPYKHGEPDQQEARIERENAREQLAAEGFRLASCSGRYFIA